MKRKAKRPAQSPNTMPPERLVPILDYLRQHAQTWDDAREAVAIRICHAFAETTLGNGIGILEADCIDDYLNETDPEYRRCRAQDEREHWENVLFQGHLENSLPRFNPFSAISFMDGAGRRFALPCYMLWALQDNPMTSDALMSHLQDGGFYEGLNLNAEEQAALYAFIRFMRQQAFAWDEDDIFDGYTAAEQQFLAAYPQVQAA